MVNALSVTAGCVSEYTVLGLVAMVTQNTQLQVAFTLVENNEE